MYQRLRTSQQPRTTYQRCVSPPFFYVSAGTYQLFHVSALVLTLLHISAPDLLRISASASITIPVLRISTASLLLCILAIPYTRCVSVFSRISSCIDSSTYQRRTFTQRRPSTQRRTSIQHCTSTQRRTSALLHIGYSAHKVCISSFAYQLLY